MEQLVKDLQAVGLTPEQIRQVFTVISKWTNENHPVMGAIIETILKKNRVIEYLD